MSSKMSTKTRKSHSHTSGSSESGSTPTRAARAPSPARLTRIQEKEELQNLNDRLAAYIDRVGFLESQNQSLSLKISQYEESASIERTNVRALYETEMGDLRRLLDALAKEKAELEIQVGKYKADSDELRARLARMEKDYGALEKRYLSAEASLGDARARMTESEKTKKYIEEELIRVRGELAVVQRSLDAGKKELEQETLLRVDLENRLQSLKEETEFARQLHAEEIRETRHRLETTMEEVDNSKNFDYEGRLAAELDELRAELEEQAVLAKADATEFYQAKIADLKAMADRNSSVTAYTRDEMRILRTRADELNAEVSRLKGANASLEARVLDLENQLGRERDEFARSLESRDREITDLRAAMFDQLKEYQDLMDAKIRLDAEIMAYRKLLEGEETRLNMSSEETPGAKRRRTTAASSFTSSSSSGGQSSQSSSQAAYSTEASYESSGSAQGIVEIEEVDADGQYIKLRNNSEDEDQHMGGWHLKLSVDDGEVEYKFYRTFNLKAGHTVMVWSHDAGTAHSPPSDLVMKSQKWVTGDALSASLVNTDGEERATRGMKKVFRSVSQRTGSRVGIAGTADQDKCRLM